MKSERRQTVFARWIIALASMSLAVACAHSPTSGTAPQASSEESRTTSTPVGAGDSITASRIHVEYAHSSEGDYEKFVINDDVVTYTHNEGHTPPANPAAQMPSYTEKDLKTKKAHLTPAEIDGWIQAVEQSRFADLKGPYGGIKPGERSYPYVIKIKVGALDKEVVYQSGLQSPPAPQQFKAIEAKIQETIRTKF